MKIAVINLTGGGLSGGYRKYLLKLAPVFQNNPAVTSSVFYVHEALRQTKGLESLQVRTWPARDHLLGYRGLKASLRQLAPDVIFIPSARWIGVDRIPTVVMVRNMEPLEVPFGGNPLLEKIKNVGRAWEAKAACRKATRVIAVSQHVKNFLVSRWEIAADKIGTVYHGIDRPLIGSDADRPACIPDDFIFTAGSIRPARGLEDLVDALGMLARNGRSYTVVIGGGVDAGMEFYKRRLNAMAAASGISQQIVWAGSLTPAQMAWCYRHCALFVMTTRAEACPNTALEAMSHGCLCVVTDKAPLPEFFVDTAWFYSGENAASLASQLTKAFDCVPDVRTQMQGAASQRATEFKWENTVQLTLAELARVASIELSVR